MDNYEEKYKQALERAETLTEKLESNHIKGFIYHIFPELMESEDERIRKEILNVFKQLGEGTTICGRNYDYAKWIAWLEKQDEQPTDKIEPNPAWSEEDEGMLTWLCRIIHSQRLDRAITLKEESELGEWMDKWLNHNTQTKQGKQKQTWKPTAAQLITNDHKREIDDAYLQGICDAKHEIEKQGEKDPCIGCTNDKGCVTCENSNMKETKAEPKFKAGDWVLNNVCFPMQIASIKDGMYIFTEGDAMSVLFIDGNYHLWTIHDAMDGDVLVNSKGQPFIFSGKYDDMNSGNPIAYCGVNCQNKFKIGNGTHWTNKNEVAPATKEQCDQLFAKMRDSGYEWNADKKELKKIESKKLDADKVIEWLKDQACQGWIEDIEVEKFVEKFKKDLL